MRGWGILESTAAIGICGSNLKITAVLAFGTWVRVWGFGVWFIVWS